MIEEQGRVLSIEPGAAWVETIRRSTCGSCQARAGCGQALMQRLGAGARQGYIRVLTDQSLSVGDEVVIGLAETAVVRASVWMYAVPLLVMFVFALLAEAMAVPEPGIILAAFVGLAAGFALVRLHVGRQQANPELQPCVLRRVSSQQALPSAG